jgi:hypothetical protein
LNSPELNITNSYLGNTQFLSTDLKSFDSINIKNSDVTQISASCVKWFDKENIEKNSNQVKLNWNKKFTFWLQSLVCNVDESDLMLNEYRLRREVYRQLKFATEKNGDRIQSLIFKEYEMDSYRKELRLSRKVIDNDRFITWSNLSNNHGQNWVKPVVFSVIFTFVFYVILIVAQSNKLYFSPARNFIDFKITYSELRENLRVFPQLFNPTRAVDKLFPSANYISGYVYTIDYLQRLVLAYFIYQTISAFRKFSK